MYPLFCFEFGSKARRTKRKKESNAGRVIEEDSDANSDSDAPYREFKRESLRIH
jgi:hypothetical protein